MRVRSRWLKWIVLPPVLTLLAGWSSLCVAADVQRLLSPPYPDLASALAVARPVQDQFATLGIITAQDPGGYRLVLAESADSRVIGVARANAGQAGLQPLQVVPVTADAPRAISIEQAQTEEFSSLSVARQKVAETRRQGGLAELSPGRERKGMIAILLGDYAREEAARHDARILDDVGIDNLVLAPRVTRTYSIAAGAFWEAENVDQRVQQLREAGLGNISLIHQNKKPTLIQLISYPDREAARRDAGVLEKAGIKHLILVPGSRRGYVISAGAFRREQNVQARVERLRELGFANITILPLRARPARYRVISLLPESQTAGQTIVIGEASGAADDLPPIPAEIPELAGTDAASANGPRLVIDPLRLEAGALTDEAAPAEGSHYLHGKLAVEWPWHEHWEGRVGARIDSYHQSGETEFDETGLDYDDTYIRYRSDSRRLTLGAQTVLWGRVDELPPTDRLSVRDVSRFVLDDVEDRRRAVPAARWEEFVGEYKLDFLYVPDFRAAELPEQDSIWSPVDRERGRFIGLPLDPRMAPLIRQGRFVEDDDGRGGWGLRLRRVGRDLDYALTVQDARHSLPYYELDPAVRQQLLATGDTTGALAAAPQTFIARHPRTWVVGGDLAYASGASTWRFELAWLSDHPATTDDLRYITLDAVDWVAGVEFFPGDRNLRITAQLRGLHLLGADQPLLDRENIHTLFGDIESPFARDRWRIRLRYSLGLDDKDVYLNPQLIYQGAEPHEMYLGYHYFDGDENTPGGFHQQHDLVTLGWRARF